jgi:hypothetical protein
MRSTATSVETGENALLAVARIDAQDDASVLPLREYLETHGVQVFVNRVPSLDVTYHIVMGEEDFVKEIFSRTSKSREKRLAIVVGYTEKEPDLKEYNSKIILVDPIEIPANKVVDIYEFFFVSDKDVLDLRTQRYSRIVHEKSLHEPAGTVPPVLHVSQKVEREEKDRFLSAARDQKRIGTIIADVYGEQGKPDVQNNEAQIKRHRKKKRRWILGLLMGLGICILPVAWYVFSITVSGVALALTARSMKTGDTRAVGWQSRVAGYWVGQGSMVLHIASVPLTWMGLPEVIRGQERLVSFFSDAASASDQVQSMVGVGQSVAAGLVNQVSVGATGTTPAADITTLQTSLDSVQNTLGLAQAELALLLKDGTFPFSIPLVAKEGTQITSELVTLRDSAANMDHLVSLFLQLAGFKEPRTYLILLQNSSELRPTGGFIGSVAVASFADGRLTDLQVQDVYTFDGQLKGHVDPPVPVRELLNQEHWYLRDSNWDPDFSVSAAKAAWFYQKETGSNVDGVFAINTPFIVDILRATGPIDLPDYNDRITADNFYGKSLYYTQNDFFPGSTQKKDFLGTLTRALLTKITTSQTTNMTALFRAMTQALSGHDLMMMFGATELESIVSHYGWAGLVPSTTGCTGVEADSCSFDPFISVEANMSVNKADSFVTRTLDRQVTVHPDGSVSETVTIEIKNTSGQDGGLSYRTYMRFLLPVDVAVAGVTLNGAPVYPRKDITTIPTLPYLERTDLTSSLYTLGVGLDVPPGSTKQLAITYTRTGVVRFGASGAVVDVFTQKQPGVSGTPVHTVIRYPVAWTAGFEEQASGAVGQDFIANTGQLEYNMVLDRDMLTRIRFTK